MNWCAGLEAICTTDVPLRDHTWYRLGGPARWFLCPTSREELSTVLARCRAARVPWRVLGRGANVLVPDRGFPGAVIKLAGADFEAIRFDGCQVRAGAAADFPRLVRQAVDRGLGGLECLAGIPGTVGGIIRMNAGGKHGSVSEFVRAVELIDAAGAIVERPVEQIGFSYRHSALDGCVVLSARLVTVPGDATEIRARFQAIWQEKYAQQPPVSKRSSGCVFKNPAGSHAGALIDRAGLKGVRVGGAEISPRHANFIVASEGTKAQDVLDLIALAKDRVWNEFGIALELEVEVW